MNHDKRHVKLYIVVQGQHYYSDCKVPLYTHQYRCEVILKLISERYIHSGSFGFNITNHNIKIIRIEQCSTKIVQYRML